MRDLKMKHEMEEREKLIDQEFKRKEDEKRKVIEEQFNKRKQQKERQLLEKKQHESVVMHTQKPLYKVYEEKYKQEVELPQLEQKKKQLEEIRNFYKPMPKTELEDHAVKYERIRQGKNEESRKLREQSLNQEREHYQRLKSQGLMSIGENNRGVYQDPKTLEDERLTEEKRKLLERVRSYAKNVKEMYWPKISEEKRQEMEQLKDPGVRQSILKLKSSLIQNSTPYRNN